jgi:hypothetical protein
MSVVDLEVVVPFPPTVANLINLYAHPMSWWRKLGHIVFEFKEVLVLYTVSSSPTNQISSVDNFHLRRKKKKKKRERKKKERKYELSFNWREMLNTLIFLRS